MGGINGMLKNLMNGGNKKETTKKPVKNSGSKCGGKKK